MRILGIERDNTACNHYRILQPLYKLREQGLADILTIEERNFNNLEFSTQKIIEADLVVFQRPMDYDWLNFIKVCQKAGKIIVCDYDDDPFTTSPFSPAYKNFGVEEAVYIWPDGTRDMLWKDGENGFDIERNISRRDMFRLNFKKADLVTTTTNILQETFKQLNPNVVVLPNLVDFNLYPKAEMVKKEIRIGWQGGYSHFEDLSIIVKPLKEILNKYKKVKFVYMGDFGFKGLFKDIAPEQLEIQNWVRHNAYPYKLVLLNLDIGICPLADTIFNRNKSAIKWMEYSVVGAATIASNIPPYSPVIKHNETALLVNDNDWFNALEELILNREKRLKLAKNAYDDIYQNHNADTKAHLWYEAYNQVLKKELVEV